MRLQIKGKKIDAGLCKGITAAIGFMFSFSSNSAKVLDFGKEKNVRLHMLFVFFPLVAVFLDNNKEVIDIIHLKPWILLTPKRKARYVVEIPLTIANNLNISKGDRIKFLK